MKPARPKATSTVQIDNERVIVTQWHFTPGAETGWHRHRHDYIVVPLSTGNLKAETEDGDRITGLTAGISYSRPKGVEHNIVNIGDSDFTFVEIELKDSSA